MHRWPFLPLLVPVALLCFGGLAAEGWMWHRVRGESVRELKALDQVQQERDWLSRQTPALSTENEFALAADVAAAERVRKEYQQMLAGHDPGTPTAPPPAGSTEAYFELAEFIRQLRARAGQAQVVLKRNECFGFGSHANIGPAADQIAAVHRQRLATEYLVGRLLEARPLALLAVRRERPGVNGTKDQQDGADDFFEPDFPASVRRPEEGEGGAYRVEFTGQTAALRNFLNGLALGGELVMVRRVQVEPLASPAEASPSLASAPLVRRMVSKFTVAVEIVRLTDQPGTAAP